MGLGPDWARLTFGVDLDKGTDPEIVSLTMQDQVFSPYNYVNISRNNAWILMKKSNVFHRVQFDADPKNNILWCLGGGMRSI